MNGINVFDGIKILTLITTLSLISGCDNVAGREKENIINHVSAYRVQAGNSDPYIYEFTPQGYPSMTCLMLANNGSSNGLQCFNKIEKSTN